MGVAVRRYIDILIIIITFPYSTCISFFWQQHPYFFDDLKNVFSFLYSVHWLHNFSCIYILHIIQIQIKPIAFYHIPLQSGFDQN